MWVIRRHRMDIRWVTTMIKLKLGVGVKDSTVFKHFCHIGTGSVASTNPTGDSCGTRAPGAAEVSVVTSVVTTSQTIRLGSVAER